MNDKDPHELLQNTDVAPCPGRKELPAARPGSAADNDPSLHRDHRTRLRKRFHDGGTDAMAPHELLELMLTYARPRVDTNPTAHRLIERFGSLGGVLSASEDELMTVPGVGQETALLIRLFAAVRRSVNLETDAAGGMPVLDSISGVIAYARPLFADATQECARLLLLDNGLRLIECRAIAEGTVNSVYVSIRMAVETCLFKHASSVVLIHNHPSGQPNPSAADLEMTHRLQSVLEAIGITLKEHIILTPNGATAILHNRRYMNQPDEE